MYYPKSQIKSNLYTAGKEYMRVDNGKEYIGYYFVLANGRVFGGSSSGNSSIELKPYQQGDSYVYSPPSGEVMKYNVLKQINNYSSINKDIPTFTQNLPTEADYLKGEFFRFFCKRVNNFIYLEVDEKVYNKTISSPSSLHIGFYIPWKLTGKKQYVYETNKNIVNLLINEQQLIGFEQFLNNDYLKYYRNE